jgi:hypothetical protein
MKIVGAVEPSNTLVARTQQAQGLKVAMPQQACVMSP